MKTILLKFAGPLQSRGTGSHFETRQTDLYPSKSAVIGLIAASFGYRRYEDERIKKLNEVKFAVRIDQQGNLLRDYHTAQKYKDSGDFERTYVTNRYYLEDAIFVIALSHTDNQFVEDIYDNLQTPYFQTFMGRRSCPPSADFVVGIYEQDILQLLKSYPWQAKAWYRKTHTNQISCFIDSELDLNLKAYPRRDYILSFSQKDRKHKYRNESHFLIDVRDCDSKNKENKTNSEHDAFSSI